MTSEKGKGPTFRSISKGYYYDKGVVSKNALIWKVKIFEHVRDKLYEINEYEFKETIYPIPKVRRALHEYFDILESKPREEGRKILFVCRKK